MSDEPTDELVSRAAAELRRPVALRAGFDDRVMAAVKAPPPPLPLWAAGLRWLTARRTIAVSPLGMIGAAAAIAGLVVGIGALATRLRPVGAGAGAPPPSAQLAGPGAPRGVEVVRFVLAAPGAARVALVGDFNGWDAEATPLHPTNGAGVWVADVPLRPGRHEYGFLVDGREWRPDPTAPSATTNDYGLPNSVITVGARRS